ncbi:LOG family protein [Flavipsychrobacter stenotrophus]|uniref:LOG family protein n=1 Tax=Flavipsychrobacter stenotrophus TaxID=2077091 RepID=UPI0037439489
MCGNAGGYGTMDDFFESITMIQTGKSKKFPVILIGKSYYLELYEYIQKMVYEKTISPR